MNLLNHKIHYLHFTYWLHIHYNICHCCTTVHVLTPTLIQFSNSCSAESQATEQDEGLTRFTAVAVVVVVLLLLLLVVGAIWYAVKCKALSISISLVYLYRLSFSAAFDIRTVVGCCGNLFGAF